MSPPPFYMLITVTACEDIVGMTECGRCHRWTFNDGPTISWVKSNGQPRTGNICWRCQGALIRMLDDSHNSDFTRSIVIPWRESRGLSIDSGDV